MNPRCGSETSACSATMQSVDRLYGMLRARVWQHHQGISKGQCNVRLHTCMAAACVACMARSCSAAMLPSRFARRLARRSRSLSSFRAWLRAFRSVPSSSLFFRDVASPSACRCSQGELVQLVLHCGQMQFSAQYMGTLMLCMYQALPAKAATSTQVITLRECAPQAQQGVTNHTPAAWKCRPADLGGVLRWHPLLCSLPPLQLSSRHSSPVHATIWYEVYLWTVCPLKLSTVLVHHTAVECYCLLACF